MSTFYNTPTPPVDPNISSPIASPPVYPPQPPVYTPPPVAYAIPLPPTDEVYINGFRTAVPEAYLKLNADFGLPLTRESFLSLQAIARDELCRDLTVAELRLLTLLDAMERGRSDREAVGELITASDTIAETWADIMDKHAALHRAQGTAKSVAVTPTPPCTYADILRLPERYLTRTGLAPRPLADCTVLTTPRQAAIAVAAGYRPVAHLAIPSDADTSIDGPKTVTVVARKAPHQPVPVRTGDYLLYLPAASLDAVADLLEDDQNLRRPTISDIRAIADTSLLDATLTLAPTVDLYTDRLFNTATAPPNPTVAPATAVPNASVVPPTAPPPIPPNPPQNAFFTVNATVAQPATTVAQPYPVTPPPRLAVAALISHRHPNGDTADFLLRVSQKHLMALTANLQNRHITAVAVGQVTDTAYVRLFLRSGGMDIPVVNLPASLLHRASTVHLHRVEVAMAPPPVIPSVQTPALPRLPGLNLHADGLTPQGHEVVALPLPTTQAVTVTHPGTHGIGVTLAAARTTITTLGTGFAAAVATLEAATRPLREAGIPPSSLRIAISVTIAEHLAASTADGITPGALTIEALCGLYRASAENGLLPADPVMTTLPAGDAPAVHLTAIAYHIGKIASADENQWSTGALKPSAALTSAVADTPTTDATAPIILMPVLRRSRENSLRAVAAALTHITPADCRLCPVAVVTVTEPTPDATATTPPSTSVVASEPIPEELPPIPPVTHEEIPSPSLENLLRHLNAATLPVFAMSESDARLLLAYPEVRASLDAKRTAGGLIVVLGEACAAFAEMGLLPNALRELATIPVAANTHASVVYTFRDTPTTRLVRCDLLASTGVNDAISLMNLTLPNQTTVADAYLSTDGRVLGILNGLDPALVGLIRRSAIPHT